MDLTVRRAAALLLLMAGMLMSPTDLSSCGPYIVRALFSFYKQPEQPADRFARGQLGILQPTYPRFYLFVAYRYLSGVPLTSAEQKALFPPAQTEPVAPLVDQWLDARKKVPGLGEPPKIVVEKTVSKPDEYYMYTNCLDDAFRSATATLQARVAKFGADSRFVKDWVKGQDAVFANCAGELPAVIPEPASADSDAMLKADRAYQIAAANLYAGNLDQAEALFGQIASDKSSPWRPISAYLVARAQIRKATIHNDAAALKKADAQLQTVLGDSSLASVHGAAKNLAALVQSRLHPEIRLAELAQVLAKPDATLDHDLADYRFLYDKFEDGRFGDAVKLPVQDDLSDWFYTFHNHGEVHAIEKWHATKSLPWLLAVLQDVHAGNSGASEAMAAADALKSDSPAFLTAAFHVNRMIIESHRDQDARNRLDALLKNRAQLPLSAANLFLAERMKVAVNWDEFLRYAQRVPAGIDWGEGADVPDNAVDDSPLKEYRKGKTTLDVDSGKILNEQIPLRMLASAATGAALPANLRARVALGGWMRAVLIGDEKMAADLASVLASLTPALKERLAEYTAAADKDHRQFAAAYLMLKYPGVRPYIETGFGRATAMEKIDDFRDNWWCSLGAKDEGSYYRTNVEIGGPLKQLYVNEQPAASFLADPERAQAGEEWKKLAALPAAPDYLAEQVIAYAKAHADDPRAPEALHLVVRATRYGCTDERTGALSKQAYNLLQARYPNSAWAKQTKYWYK
jgi:hypothetical protein